MPTVRDGRPQTRFPTHQAGWVNAPDLLAARSDIAMPWILARSFPGEIAAWKAARGDINVPAGPRPLCRPEASLGHRARRVK